MFGNFLYGAVMYGYGVATTGKPKKPKKPKKVESNAHVGKWPGNPSSDYRMTKRV